MRPLALILALALALSGCGLSYEITWPFDFGPGAYEGYALRGEQIPRSLYTDACEYPFGLTLTDTAQPCVADLEAAGRTVWMIDELAFFGSARARLYVNSWDELDAFVVEPDTPGQFDGIVDHYATLFRADPRSQSEPVGPCPSNDPAHVPHDDGVLRDRSAEWYDARTRLVITEEGCTGLVTLRFTDRYARP